MIEILQGNQVLFKIPLSLYKKVQRVNYNLTGQVYLHPGIFVNMVNYGLIWDFAKHVEDGGAVAFGFQGAAYDKGMTYEEAILQADQMRMNMKESLHVQK